MRRRRESPIRRVNPSGKVVWVARYTGLDGKRRSAGTRERKHEAQRLIDQAYEREARGAPETVGAYHETWSERHPRAARTNRTNDGRIRNVLDLEFGGRKLRDWPFRDLRRRHALELVGLMLTEQGRATTGAQNVLRALSAMAEDAITDEIAEVNFVRGVKVRANDPRATKERRPPRVLTFEEMHELAAHAGKHEAMVRVLSDCGLRLGELFGIARTGFDGDMIHVLGNVVDAVFIPGNQATKQHVRDVPVPPSCAKLLRAQPARIDTPWLFATPAGKLWWERNFKRDVWYPMIERAAGVVDPELPANERRRLVVARGFDIRPHDFRHSWVTHLRAAGIDEADVAERAGHTLATAARYTHPLGRSDDQIRGVIG